MGLNPVWPFPQPIARNGMWFRGQPRQVPPGTSCKEPPFFSMLPAVASQEEVCSFWSHHHCPLFMQVCAVTPSAFPFLPGWMLVIQEETGWGLLWVLPGGLHGVSAPWEPGVWWQQGHLLSPWAIAWKWWCQMHPFPLSLEGTCSVGQQLSLAARSGSVCEEVK